MFVSMKKNTKPFDHSLSAKTAAKIVVEKLTLRILNEFKPGMQLPSEADLAVEFLVSRITIREALKVLSGRGLVEIARGRRAEIKQPDGSAYSEFLRSLIKSEPKCLFDLLQVRRSLEIQSVVLASRHASRAGLAAIEAALQAMRQAVTDFDKSGDEAAETGFHQADVGFHEAMALAGGNRVLTYLFEGMSATLQEAFISSRKGQLLRGYTLQDSIESHVRIFQFVSDRDEKSAADATTMLLDNAEKDLRAAYGNWL
jgi:GntR family transcriptional regulator, transcriptional repressor for pyruvate dehydrogenase complex